MWDEILKRGLLEWNLENPVEAFLASYSNCRALIGLGRTQEAQVALEKLRESGKSFEKMKPEDSDNNDPAMAYIMGKVMKLMSSQILELEGLLALERGMPLKAVEILTRAARRQEEHWHNDPPFQANYLYNVLGETYLELGSPRLAAAAYEKTLETVFNDGFALAGLVRAYHQAGNKEKARKALSALKVVWSDADKPNRWLASALATGIDAPPHLEAPLEQRNYKKEILDRMGPSLWHSPAAPAFAAVDSAGKKVTLEDFAGKNVLLIFYLGEDCLHCIEQIEEVNKRVKKLSEQDTVVIAVSKDSIEEIEAYEKSGKFEITLLSDPAFANARRFKSYDDFEEIELHSTILIDKQRRVHWASIGGAPFMNFDYLEREIKRLNAGVVHAITSGSGGGSR
jgi:peroxiredoxin